MQCFPVPPKGDMKIRFGVTAPLLLESPGEALLRLPHILERNFNLGTEHEVTLQSPSTMETTGAVWSVLDSTAPKVSAKLSDLQMSGPTALVRAQRPASTNAVWSKDSRSSDGTVVRQAVDKQKAETPRHVILVVDGSAYMRDSMSAIADSLTKLPDGISYGLVWAGDEAIELQPQQSTTRDNLLATAAALKALPCVGGADNTPALDLACKQFANADGNVIVWVHGPQPVLFENADKVRERWQKAKHPIKLYDVQIIPGPNRIAEKLDGIHAFQLWSQTGIASTDLERLFGLWAGVIDETTFKRERVSLPDVEKFPQASDHVTRLWAAEEVNRLVDEDTDPSTDAAVSLASKYQLVTSVTGAVVLETKQQFTEAGLEPVDANSVPTIPESETYALIAVLLAVLVWAYKRRQRWQVA